MEGPVADQMHDNETEISDFTDVASFYHSAFFASNGHQRQSGKKKNGAKKKGKTFYKTLFSVPGKQAEGEGVGFSAPIIVTFGVTERIH